MSSTPAEVAAALERLAPAVAAGVASVLSAEADRERAGADAREQLARRLEHSLDVGPDSAEWMAKSAAVCVRGHNRVAAGVGAAPPARSYSAFDWLARNRDPAAMAATLRYSISSTNGAAEEEATLQAIGEELEAIQLAARHRRRLVDFARDNLPYELTIVRSGYVLLAMTCIEAGAPQSDPFWDSGVGPIPWLDAEEEDPVTDPQILEAGEKLSALCEHLRRKPLSKSPSVAKLLDDIEKGVAELKAAIATLSIDEPRLAELQQSKAGLTVARDAALEVVRRKLWEGQRDLYRLVFHRFNRLTFAGAVALAAGVAAGSVFRPALLVAALGVALLFPAAYNRWRSRYAWRISFWWHHRNDPQWIEDKKAMRKERRFRRKHPRLFADD